MDIIFQIIFGGFTGWMLSKRTQISVLYVIFGVSGAMFSSLLMNVLNLPGVYGYNVYSFFVAMSGAVCIILAGHFFYSFLRRSNFLTERRLVPREN